MGLIQKPRMGPIDFAVGSGCCGVLLIVAASGGVYGLLYGSGANDKYPPGLWSAIFSAMTWLVFLGPFAAIIGGVAGGLYALGVIVGQRRRAKTFQPDQRDRTA